LIEAGLHRFARGDFAFGETSGEFRNGQLIEHWKIFIQRKDAKAQRRGEFVFLGVFAFL